MKKIIKSLLIILISAQISIAQVDAPYQVGTWPSFKSCAISYTFDDGCSGQFSKAIPIFDEFDYKLTLFTVTDWVASWSALSNAAGNGHEVACHTKTHPNLKELAVDAQEDEIKLSTELIDSEINMQSCVTMATPYCAEGSDSLASEYFIAVRGCQGFIESKTPANFMNVSSIICGDQGSVKTSANFKSQANSAATKKGWLVYLLHGIDNDGGYSPLPSDTLKKSLEYLKENDEKFWVATFGDVARYIKERNCAIITELATTDTSISLNVSDTLNNDEIFNYPITIRRSLPEGWDNATVSQNGKEVSYSLIYDATGKLIQFDAIPDAGSVTITKAPGTGIKDMGLRKPDLKIWINNSDLIISIPEMCENNPSVSIYNLLGERVFNKEGVSVLEGNCSISPLPFNQSGVYIIKVSDRQNSWSKQLHYF